MKLTVLTVPDCPNGPLLDQRLAEVLADRPDVPVTRHVITDERTAAEAGMHGSPTLLIDGTDPFAGQATPASASCRLYRDTDGRVSGAPSTAALRQALGFAETPTEPREDPLGRAATCSFPRTPPARYGRARGHAGPGRRRAPAGLLRKRSLLAG